MKTKSLWLILIFLLIILALTLVYALKRETPKPIYKPQALTMPQDEKILKNFQIKNAKLPLPKQFISGAIRGAITYQNAIHIARDYFERGEYASALRWAQKADSLSHLDKQAWLLYAQSLHALGYQSEARAVLASYKILTKNERRFHAQRP